MNTLFHKLTGGILGREEWRIHLTHSNITTHIHTISYWSPPNSIILSNHTGERIKWRTSLIKLFWRPLKFCWPFYGTLESKLQLSNPLPHSKHMRVMKLDSMLHGSALSCACLGSSLAALQRGVTRILLISHKRRINWGDNRGQNVRPQHLLANMTITTLPPSPIDFRAAGRDTKHT